MNIFALLSILMIIEIICTASSKLRFHPLARDLVSRATFSAHDIFTSHATCNPDTRSDHQPGRHLHTGRGNNALQSRGTLARRCLRNWRSASTSPAAGAPPTRRSRRAPARITISPPAAVAEVGSSPRSPGRDIRQDVRASRAARREDSPGRAARPAAATFQRPAWSRYSSPTSASGGAASTSSHVARSRARRRRSAPAHGPARRWPLSTKTA